MSDGRPGTKLAWYSAMGMLPIRLNATPASMGQAALGALLALGCADLLGMDGVTFDRAEDAIVEPTPIDEDEDENRDNDEGLGGIGGDDPKEPPTRAELWGFPIRWPGALVVAGQLPPTSAPVSPEHQSPSTFHVYEQATGHLTSYRLSDGEAAETIAHEWVPKTATTFTNFIVRPSDEGLGLLAYDSVSGRNEYAALWDPWMGSDETDAPLVPVPVEEHAGSQGWSHLTVFRHHESWRLLAYNQQDGVIRLAPADPLRAEGAPGLAGDWEPGWSHVLPYDLGESGHGLLKLDAQTGAVELAQLQEDGLSIDTMATAQWDVTFELALTFVTAAGPRVVLYDPRLGKAHLGRLNEDLGFEPIITNGLWETGWTSLTFVDVDGIPHAIAHRSGDGESRIIQLEPFEVNTPTQVR